MPKSERSPKPEYLIRNLDLGSSILPNVVCSGLTLPDGWRSDRPRAKRSGQSRSVRAGDLLRTGTVRGPVEDRPQSAVCGPLERRGKITRALAIAGPLLA